MSHESAAIAHIAGLMREQDIRTKRGQHQSAILFTQALNYTFDSYQAVFGRASTQRMYATAERRNEQNQQKEISQ